MRGDHSDENGADAGAQEWPHTSVIVGSEDLTSPYPRKRSGSRISDRELFVLDGGPTDETVEIIREHESELA